MYDDLNAREDIDEGPSLSQRGSEMQVDQSFNEVN